MSFLIAIFHLTFDFCFDVLVSDVLEVTTLASFTTIWLQLSNREECYVSRQCSSSHTPSFSDGIFLRQLIEFFSASS